jgi:uncharacterized protein YdhG (YjbR/CyaY superfamily)
MSNCLSSRGVKKMVFGRKLTIKNMNAIKRESYKRSGNILIDRGVWLLQHGFNVKPEITTQAYMKSLIKARTGIINIRFADNKYYYVDIDTIKDILKHDMVDEKEYVAEKFDCDDFAETIRTVFNFVFEINTMGTARGIKMVDPNTNETIGWHRANVFMATEKGEPKLWYLEPQNDDIKEITSKEITGVKGFTHVKLVLGDFDF